MIMSDDYNFAKLVESQLADIVKSEIEKSILREVMSDFESRASEIIKRHVSQISFDAVKSMSDMVRLREEIHMYVHYNDEKPDKLTDHDNKLAQKEG
jgi:hypothetical protein